MTQMPPMPPPPWPEDSVAHLSDPERWPQGMACELAGRVAEVVPRQARRSSPLADGPGLGQRWLTSGAPAARADAGEAYEQARRDLSLRGPEGKVGLERSLDELLGCAEGCGTVDTHGGYMAYAPTGALFEGALAAFGCAAINPGLTWMPTSPRFAAMERCVLDWVASDVLRWPDTNSGVFTSGGSIANTLGLHVAREAVARRAGVRAADVRFFLPEHAHYCFAKGLRVLGVAPEHIVRIPSGLDSRLDPQALTAVLAAASQKGQAVAGVLIAVGGETSTGAVDPLNELASIRAAHQHLWLHVDACFGGFFTLTQRGAALLSGLDKADSVALDPHKALQTPYGNGLLMVRSEADLRQAFSMGAAYTPPGGSAADGIADIADLGLELTRDARAAQVWMPLRAYGTQAFASHLNWCQDAAAWVAATLLAGTDELELVTPPQLSTLTVRMSGHFPGVAPRELAEWLVDSVLARGRVLIAPTTVAGEVPCVRVCILSARSRPAHLEHLTADLVAAAADTARCARRLSQARLNPARALGFRVPYTVRPWPGKGLSIVATEDIAVGSVVWEFEEGACLRTTAADVQRVAREQGPDAAGDYLNHCFCWGGEMLYPQGDTQFFNHSKHANIGTLDRCRWLALRPIAAGEEILDDYATFESLDAYERLCQEFGVDSSSLVAVKFHD